MIFFMFLSCSLFFLRCVWSCLLCFFKLFIFVVSVWYLGILFKFIFWFVCCVFNFNFRFCFFDNVFCSLFLMFLIWFRRFLFLRLIDLIMYLRVYIVWFFFFSLSLSFLLCFFKVCIFVWRVFILLRYLKFIFFLFFFKIFFGYIVDFGSFFIVILLCFIILVI